MEVCKKTCISLPADVYKWLKARAKKDRFSSFSQEIAKIVIEKMQKEKIPKNEQ